LDLKESLDWWLHGCYFPENSDFIEYVLKNRSVAKEQCVEKMLSLVKRFETDSGLLSKINADLASQTPKNAKPK